MEPNYHRWRFKIPTHIIQNTIGEALEAQVTVPKVGIPFEAACYSNPRIKRISRTK